MSDFLPPTYYTGKDKKILKKTSGSLISFVEDPTRAFKITYRAPFCFEIRLNNGHFYDLYEQNDMFVEPNIDAVLFEYEVKFHKAKVHNGYSMASEPFTIFSPLSNEYNQRDFFFHKNEIIRDKYGNLITYNMDIIKNKGIIIEV